MSFRGLGFVGLHGFGFFGHRVMHTLACACETGVKHLEAADSQWVCQDVVLPLPRQ